MVPFTTSSTAKITSKSMYLQENGYTAIKKVAYNIRQSPYYPLDIFTTANFLYSNGELSNLKVTYILFVVLVPGK